MIRLSFFIGIYTSAVAYVEDVHFWMNYITLCSLIVYLLDWYNSCVWVAKQNLYYNAFTLFIVYVDCDGSVLIELLLSFLQTVPYVVRYSSWGVYPVVTFLMGSKVFLVSWFTPSNLILNCLSSISVTASMLSSQVPK